MPDEAGAPLRSQDVVESLTGDVAMACEGVGRSLPGAAAKVVGEGFLDSGNKVGHHHALTTQWPQELNVVLCL